MFTNLKATISTILSFVFCKVAYIEPDVQFRTISAIISSVAGLMAIYYWYVKIKKIKNENEKKI